ncbi:hypothetical protein JMF97_06325 [Micromonospora fiedleri]|uniref:Uncharacterized protein n=1 Tax=Micromonospora fiedleri TaxID=1157498 RepID=A0ABS1UHF6_9ACTN|nr:MULTISPECIES: hypothetical protein [Micromonospora]MBL6275773.1 hypothetical protein [Micromonospora fiedleri]WSK41884.1 hypothetical protein OG712_25890 [Micromonospora maris]
MAERELHCDTCEGPQLFEVPPCLDGHGPTCPELACTRCGTALFLAPTPTPLRHPLPTTRRAA